MKITKNTLRELILEALDDLSAELVQDREVGGEPTAVENQIEQVKAAIGELVNQQFEIYKRGTAQHNLKDLQAIHAKIIENEKILADLEGI